jgi:hypothetical protein
MIKIVGTSLKIFRGGRPVSKRFEELGVPLNASVVLVIEEVNLFLKGTPHGTRTESQEVMEERRAGTLRTDDQTSWQRSFLPRPDSQFGLQKTGVPEIF